MKVTDGQINAVLLTKVLRLFVNATEDKENAVHGPKVLQTSRKSDRGSVKRRKLHEGATNFPQKRRRVGEMP